MNCVQRQAESLQQIQKRPSTHKNMQSSNKIFDIDKSNTANAVRKTEEHVVNSNTEAMEPTVMQNAQQTANQSQDQVQRNILPYQQASGTQPISGNQDVIYPFLTDEMINQMVSGAVQ